MNWFTQAFNEQSIAWLLIFSVVSAIFGFLSSWFTYHFIKRRELLDLQKMDDEKQKRERIRREVVRWANPLLSSVRDLRSQLRNILFHYGYLALGKNYKKQVNPDWSISYEYFMSSLPYQFGQYFAWVQMLQDELNFELFETQDKRDLFFNAVFAVNRALSSFPPSSGYTCQGKDTQVFALQQRAMGELLIIRDGEHKRCMSYPEFLEKMGSHDFSRHFQPLLALLEKICPEDECRWKRLEATLDALLKLEEVCKDVFDLKNPG